MEKLKNYGGGKLFEPQSLLENEKVAYIGYGVLGDSDKWRNTWLHLGITDNVLEGTWAYESDGSNITFVPYWQDNYNDQYGNCIVINAVQYGQGTYDDIVSVITLFCGTNLCIYVPLLLSGGIKCIPDANYLYSLPLLPAPAAAVNGRLQLTRRQ